MLSFHTIGIKHGFQKEGGELAQVQGHFKYNYTTVRNTDFKSKRDYNIECIDSFANKIFLPIGI